MPEIKRIIIEDWKGVWKNVDREQIAKENVVELKNLKPYNGKLIKTKGIGAKITAVTAQILDNLTTYIHESLLLDDLTGEVYIGVYVNDSTYAVSVYGLVPGTPDLWKVLNDLTDFSFSGTYYHKNAKNPILLYSDDLRILPGNLGLEPNASNECKGIWIGYINRSYFDGLYTPTVKFYDEELPIEKPTFIQEDDLKLNEFTYTGGPIVDADTFYYRFSAIYDGNQESLLSDVRLFWDVSANVKGVRITLQLKTSSLTPNNRITAYNVYRATSIGGTYEKLMTVDLLRPAAKVPQNTEGSYADPNMICIPELANKTFTDGKIQLISLDSGTTKYPVTPIMGGLTLAFVDGGGSDDTITDSESLFVSMGFAVGDLIEIAGASTSANNGTYTITAVVAGTLSFAPGSWNTAETFARGTTIIKNIATSEQLFTFVPAFLSGGETIQLAFVDSNPDTITDSQNRFLLRGFNVGDTITVAGSPTNDGTYTIAAVTAGEIELDGGDTLNAGNFDNDTILTAATHAISSDAWDKKWALYEDGPGSVDNENTDSGSHAGTNVEFISTVLAKDDYVGGIIDIFTIGFAVITENEGSAVHVTEDVSAAPFSNNTNTAWYIMRPSDGLYHAYLAGDIWMYLFDTGDYTPAGDHPLISDAGEEVSIKINGEFAQMINGRVFQANLVLDPGGKNEVHTDWASYSELDQPDVHPVSNVLRIIDREGGALTGLANILDNPVFLKEQAIVTYKVSHDPAVPANWVVQESPHNIGNLAKQGYINVFNNLYVCYHDGIYEIKPNNLAETDSTPTEILRVSEPINDTYLALSLDEKKAIISSYEQSTTEIMFVLGSEIWAYNIMLKTWREINSGVTANIFAYDELMHTIVYQTSDKKVYSFNNDESVATVVESKSFHLNNDRAEIIRYLYITYKSGDDLTVKTYSENDIVSGDIRQGTTYYVNGYTTVVYNGVTYNDTNTFTGLGGKGEYSTTGSGTVELFDTAVLSANNAVQTKVVAPRIRGHKFKFRIETSASTNDVTISKVEIEHT